MVFLHGRPAATSRTVEEKQLLTWHISKASVDGASGCLVVSVLGSRLAGNLPYNVQRFSRF